MLTRIFDAITRASVRWRWLTILLTFLVLALGAWSYTQLNQELLPPVEFPQTIVVAQWPDAEDTDQFLSEVTVPLEQSLGQVEGVVNVESTTNPTFAVITVRNEFGVNQDKLVETLRETAEATDLPPEMDPPDVFTFSLSDLPVVSASVSSGELTLQELKAVVEEGLQPELETVNQVSEVSISGGQELPETEIVDETDTSPEEEETVFADLPPSALSRTMRAGLRLYGLPDYEFAQDVTPEDAVALVGLGPIALTALNEISDDNARALQPETMAYLPSDYTDRLDNDLLDELNERSAEFGGVGQFTLREAADAKADGINILTGNPLGADEIAQVPPTETPEPTATSEPTETPLPTATTAPTNTPAPTATVAPTNTPEPTDEPVAANNDDSSGGIALPESWVLAASSQGVEIATTDDLTPEFVSGIAQFAPQLLADLTPEMLAALPAEVAAVLPAEASADESAEAAAPAIEPLDVEIQPIPMPQSWVLAAAMQGIEITDSTQVTPEFVTAVATFMPALMADLTAEQLLNFPSDALAAVPDGFVRSLTLETQAFVAARLGEPFNPEEVALVALQPQGLPLPLSWQATTQQFGMPIVTTGQVTPELVVGLNQFADELFNDLTAEQLLDFPADALAAVPQTFINTLALDTQAAVADKLALAAAEAEEAPAASAPAANSAELDAVPLPEAWVAAAAAQGLTVETTADVTPEFIQGIASFSPEALNELTPEMIVNLPDEALAALPSDFVAGLDADTQLQLAERFGGAPPIAEAPAEPAMPSSNVELEAVPLPESWIEAASLQGLTIETTADVAPELIQGIATFSPEALAELTPEMIVNLPDEALAALPGDFLAGLDADTQLQLAERFGGAPPMAEAPAEPAEPVDGTALPPSWVAGAGAAGITLQVAEEVPAEFVSGIFQFAPELFDELTPEMVLAFPVETQAALPEAFVATLDAETAGAIEANVAAADLPDPEPVDPARLPDFFITGAEQAGVELEFAQDVTPDLIRLFGGLGEQGVQALGLLTPDNLRLLNPEVLALLPIEYLDTLDADLRSELDDLAADFGGAGQLLIEEQEAAAALAEGAPSLSGIWLEPNPEGEPSLFQTAADLVNNPFAPGAAALLNFFPNSPNVDDPRDWMGVLDVPVISFLAENEADFAANLDIGIVELFPAESISFLLDNYPDAFDADSAERLAGVAAGDIEVFVPESSITRTNGNPSIAVSVFRESGANTVQVATGVEEEFAAFESTNSEVEIETAFEQASFIVESINGVAREGTLGAAFAILIILIFLSGTVKGRYRLSWRATLITSLSIPASILFAFLLMRWLPDTVGVWLNNLAESTGNGALNYISKLVPAEITLNIMTLSGLTVAIGRVVDDSIVVLENSYRYIQKGEDPVQAVFRGTREVAVAIFAATVTTMAVFLPLGLVGGSISEFFLPFGLTVTYALIASYVVSITVVPALTALLIRKENIPEEKETWMQRGYTPILKWALSHRILTMLIATVIFASSLLLLGRLPQSFIPSLGEPTVNVLINLPPGTQILETNALVEEFEAELAEKEGVESILTEVGGSGGFEAFFGGGVTQNAANLIIGVEDQEELDALAEEVREAAQTIFGEESVTVSAEAQSGFGGFAIIVTGAELDELLPVVDDVIGALETLDADADGNPDLLNITTNAEAAADGETIIRIDGSPAVSFGGEINTADTIGVATAAKEAIGELDSLPAGAVVTEGFDSEQQTQGFQSMIRAIGWSIVIVYLIMALTFRSLTHPFTILFSLPFALVGASVALFISNSVLGISAMVGMLMLVGVVVTNGIVLMELVQQLKEESVPTYDALVEAGRTRLRPIWMTALTAILALIPLAISSEGGAIIAAELGTTVIGGLTVSTALTLIVIPVVYSLIDSAGNRMSGLFGRNRSTPTPAAGD